MLHTLLHVAQWPCVPSGVTSTFAPQSSHFGLSIILRQKSATSGGIAWKEDWMLKEVDTVHSCNVRHHHQCTQRALQAGRWQGRSRHHSLAIVHLSSPPEGGLRLLRLIIARARSTCTEPAGTWSYPPLMMAKQRFRYPKPKECCISCDQARMLSASQQLTACDHNRLQSRPYSTVASRGKLELNF